MALAVPGLQMWGKCGQFGAFLLRFLPPSKGTEEEHGMFRNCCHFTVKRKKGTSNLLLGCPTQIIKGGKKKKKRRWFRAELSSRNKDCAYCIPFPVLEGLEHGGVQEAKKLKIYLMLWGKHGARTWKFTSNVTLGKTANIFIVQLPKIENGKHLPPLLQRLLWASNISKNFMAKILKSRGKREKEVRLWSKRKTLKICIY